ncbi:MAG: glycosyltransferase family 4 protein [Bacteroidales bacterium]|nr:glycosyltransferase family 4 protein [Bacteroidales bacterium]
MKIAVNTRLLIHNKLDGIGWFTYNTLKIITQNHPEHTFYFIFDRNYDNEFIFSENVIPIVVPPPTRHPVLWNIWLKVSVPKALKKINIDFFLSPDGFLPSKLNIPSVTVIHDINFAHNPKDLPLSTRNFYNKNFPDYAQKTTRIATVSEFSKRDIVYTYKISPKKIDVVYNGANIDYKPVDENTKIETKKKYTDGEDYFIFIGAIHPRKNIKRLIIAFDEFKKNTEFSHKLVIVGPHFFKNSELLKTYESLDYKEDIIFTGRLNVEDLHKVLASAFAMTFVPYFEGFGIPILEAMFCDVPVISANVTSMPEVAEDAALYVNPMNISEIAGAMHKIIIDEELRNSLIKKGKLQRQKFSWEKTAEKLWKTIEIAASEKQSLLHP